MTMPFVPRYSFLAIRSWPIVRLVSGYASTGRVARHGMAALPTLLALSGIVLTVSLGMAISSQISNYLNTGSTRSTEALYAAQAGLNDALWRLARNKNYENLSGYNLAVGSGTANIVIDRDEPVVNQTTVTVSGTVSGRTRKIQAVINVTATVGALSQASWTEID